MKIDIGKVIGDKNPGLLKVIPGFVIKWLGRLIRQDEINYVLKEAGDLEGAEFASASLNLFNIKYTAHGLENIDLNRRYIIVSNHPLGGLDGIIMIEMFGKLFNSVKFVVNDLLYHVEPLKPVFIPVNKYGRQSVETADMIKESYLSNSQILYFPAGLCSRLTKGEIKDPEWRRSYINQAIKYERDILPIYFKGKNSKLFYWAANIRKRLGIKFNYESILLPREMFKKENQHFDIYIGEPITYQELISNKDISGWNKKIRERVYSLKK